MALKPAFFLFLILNANSFATGDWKQSVKEMKEKLKNLYKFKEALRDNSIVVSVGSKPTPDIFYPKNDEKKMKIIDEMWRSYYNCLQLQTEALDADKTLPANAPIVIAGNSVTLDCTVCISPNDIEQEITWHYTSGYLSDKNDVEEISQTDANVQISPYVYSLHIYNARPEHEGVYFCKIGGHRGPLQFLHVVDDEEVIVRVRPRSAKKGPKGKVPVSLDGTNLAIWNNYSPWSECNKCNMAGQRTRYGFCTVSTKGNVQAEDAIRSGAFPKLEESLMEEMNIMLSLFDYGIPCRSKLLPEKFPALDFVKNYTSEIMIGFCKIPCMGEVLLQILNETGAVVQEINNTAGEYSIYQDAPGIPPRVENKIQRELFKKKFTLECPGNLFANAPVEWTANGKFLTNEALKVASEHRISIDSLNRIVFLKLDYVDAKVYVCWQKKQIAGIVKLEVEPPPTINPVSIMRKFLQVVAFFVVILFGYVTVKVTINRKVAMQAQGKIRKGQ